MSIEHETKLIPIEAVNSFQVYSVEIIYNGNGGAKRCDITISICQYNVRLKWLYVGLVLLVFSLWEM